MVRDAARKFKSARRGNFEAFFRPAGEPRPRTANNEAGPRRVNARPCGTKPVREAQMQSNSSNYPRKKSTVKPCVRCRKFKGYQPGGLCAKCYRTPGVREQYETWRRSTPCERVCPECKATFIVQSPRFRKTFCSYSCSATNG